MFQRPELGHRVIWGSTSIARLIEAFLDNGGLRILWPSLTDWLINRNGCHAESVCCSDGILKTLQGSLPW